MEINVVLADDHPALVAGVKHALDAVASIKITGTAQNPSELIQVLDSVKCDVLVADYSMPDDDFVDGISLFSFLRRRYPELRIVVFTMVDNPAIIREVAKLGVHSYINKGDDLERLISAIHAVYARAVYFPNDIGRQNHALKSLSESGSEKQALSKREVEVLRLYVSGLSINEIAKKLNRSKQTISTQKIMAMKKLGIEREAELFRYAWETGLSGDPSFSPANDQ